MVEYWDSTLQQTRIKYISQEYIFPLSYNSGELTELAIASEIVIKGRKYTYLEVHRLNEGLYEVDNVILDHNRDGSYADLSDEFYKENNIEKVWATGSDKPLFQIIRPNVADRHDFNNPFGTSVYSGHIDELKAIDIIYDSYVSEFELGRKRIFVKDGVASFNINSSGETVKVFDPNDKVFYSLPGDADDSKDQIVESNMALRVSEHDTAIQTHLNKLGLDVGLGANTLRWDHGSVATATQVISENSDMFRTLRKHETLMREAIIAMAHGLLYVEKIQGKDESIVLDDEITVDFDDSIIEDTKAIKDQALIELNAGIISRQQYYQDVYGMTKAQAKTFCKDMLSQISEEQQELQSGQSEEPAVSEEPVIEETNQKKA